MINSELRREKVHLPFSHVLILTDTAMHERCPGSYGLFRFHFPLKALN